MASHPNDETALGGTAPQSWEFYTGSNRKASAKATQSKRDVAHVRATETCVRGQCGRGHPGSAIDTLRRDRLLVFLLVRFADKPARWSPRWGARPGMSPKTSQDSLFLF